VARWYEIKPKCVKEAVEHEQSLSENCVGDTRTQQRRWRQGKWTAGEWNSDVAFPHSAAEHSPAFLIPWNKRVADDV